MVGREGERVIREAIRTSEDSVDGKWHRKTSGRLVFRPEGRKPGQPIVEVSKSVVKKLGEPKVDYDLLDEMFRNEFDIPTRVTPKVKLYGRSKVSLIQGFHIPYTHSIHVQAVTTENPIMGRKHKLIPVTLHESQHLSDFQNHRILSGAASGLKMVPVQAGTLAAGAISTVTPEVADGMFTFIAPYYFYWKYYKHIDPLEHRARKPQGNQELVEKYNGAIVFDSPKEISINKAKEELAGERDKGNEDDYMAPYRQFAERILLPDEKDNFTPVGLNFRRGVNDIDFFDLISECVKKKGSKREDIVNDIAYGLQRLFKPALVTRK